MQTSKENNLGITPDWILNYLVENFQGIKVIEAWGEIGCFYNPDNLLKRGTYFCTLKARDGENDTASDLNRAGVFRMNFGVSKETFLSIFKAIPKRPEKGNCISGEYDFKALDIILPHPVYAWMTWVSILNPSMQSFETLQSLLTESYGICFKKYTQRLR